jgi:hypothetical protein
MAENLRPAQSLAVDVCTVCVKTLKERSARERLIFKSSGSVLDVRELKNSAYAGDYRRITYETNTATIVGTLQSCMRDMVPLHPLRSSHSRLVCVRVWSGVQCSVLSRACLTA